MNKIAKLSDSFTKEFGGSIRTAEQIPDLDVVPTNLPSFNLRLQDCGGFPRGRVIEAYGGESSCKSTFASYLSGMGTLSDPGYTTMWLDVEGCFVPSWAEKMGQNLSHTIFPPDLYWAEDYLRAIKWAIVHGIDMVVLDCVTMMVARAVGERHLNKDKTTGRVLEKQSEGVDEERPLSMKEMLARATFFAQTLCPDLQAGFTWGKKKYRLKESKTFVYFINQIRDSPNKYGYVNIDKTPCGQALKHMYSARWSFKRLGKSKEVNKAGDPLHQVIQIENTKNKVGTPFRTIQLMLDFNGGFRELEESFFDIVEAKGLIKPGKQGYYFIGEQKFHGKGEVTSYIKEHPELLEGSFIEDATLDVVTSDKKEVKPMSAKVRKIFNSGE